MAIDIQGMGGSALRLAVAVDLTRNGTFSDSNEDITGYVKSIEWQNGFAQPFDVIARDTSLRLTLNNADKRFSPENTGGALGKNFTRGRVIRVSASYSGSAFTMLNAWIGAIRPSAGKFLDRQVEVETEGYMSRAQKAEVFIPVQSSKTADQVIGTVMSNTNIYPPGFTGRWLLGTIGFSELGENTILGVTSDYLNAETGKSTFVFAGDNWHDGVSVYGALKELSGREFGRLYLDRSGIINWWNRHHLITATTISASFNDTMQGIGYEYGDDVINRVIVQARPRLVSASGQTLGQTDRAFKVKASGSALVAFRYADQSSGANISGCAAISPSRNTDFTGNTASDGSGTDNTSLFSTCIINQYATRTEVMFGNSHTADLWVGSGAKIRGTKITDWGQVDMVRQDDASIGLYGRQLWSYPYAMDNISDASALVDYMADIRNEPRGRVITMTITPRNSAALMTQAMQRTIGDRIAIAETQTGTAADYFIIGEIHKFDMGAVNYQVTWLLERADANQYWVLGATGFSELGQTTYLGPL